MQVVILAAGRGTRLRPLTLKVPKPLVLLNNKPILEHIMDELPNDVDEVILVVGYMGDKIRKYFGNNFGGKKIKYAIQKDQRGTFHALKQAQKFIKNDFLILMADDVYSKKDLTNLAKSKNAILVKRVSGPSEKFGACLTKNGRLLDIREKEMGVRFEFASCGSYKLDMSIFSEPIICGPNGEEWLSSMVGSMAKKKKIKIIKATRWFPIATPDDLKIIGDLIKV
ncbi:MAG: sugar phosphate nucleotidyltransferase [bacterium]|nr:sugar phosphate nucleotidyltransferase [bacterium]